MDQQSVLECDVAVIGGGLGGVAASLAACEAGARVILTEETDWIGGQATAQLVSALDEHPYIEQFGGTRSYHALRAAIRQRYLERYRDQMVDAADPALNPGGGWVSALCFEPRVGLAVLEDLLRPFTQTGQLTLLLNTRPVAARCLGGRVEAVRVAHRVGTETTDETEIRAAYFLDATELGDLLPLTGAPYSSGAEAVEDTGEPNASRDGAHPDQVQAFTCCFILEHREGEDHTIARPRSYERWRAGFHLDVPAEAGGAPIHYPVFTPETTGPLTFWTYRRVFDAARLAPGSGQRDLALINWDGNDYTGGNLIDASPAEQAAHIAQAKALSRAFLYWLQTEVPRDDGRGRGYPGLRIVPEAAGTADGFGKAPYIREARRIRGLKRVVEQDITARPGSAAARALPFADSVGVGHYPIDVHACCNGPMPDYHFDKALPFQIPLGALIPAGFDNLLAAAKNLSVTHITNGAYRLHPVEWNSGEAAGALAAFCLAEGCRPEAVEREPERLHRFQHALLARGVPLAWAVDAPPESADFIALQTSLVRAPLRLLQPLPPPVSPRFGRLDLRADEPLTAGEAIGLLEAAAVQQTLVRWQNSPSEPVAAADLRQVCAAGGYACDGLSDAPTYRELARILFASRA
jgi:hypothetical protein